MEQKTTTSSISAELAPYRVLRFDTNPLITRATDASLGNNINGPSVIRVPDWVPYKLGRYYLYFAHHHGKCIRLAVADQPQGPWRLYVPGVLPLAATGYTDHLASPDVHVDEKERRIRLYFHARNDEKHQYIQYTHVATSGDGLNFVPDLKPLHQSAYWRVFQHGGWHYALSMPGMFHRAKDPLGPFEHGPKLFETEMRHAAVRVRGDVLDVFYSRWGDTPEHLVWSEVQMKGDWNDWQAAPARTLLLPQEQYEGHDLPVETSKKGWAMEPLHELRDPGVFEEGGTTYLYYSIQAEQGLAGGVLEPA